MFSHYPTVGTPLLLLSPLCFSTHCFCVGRPYPYQEFFFFTFWLLNTSFNNLKIKLLLNTNFTSAFSFIHLDCFLIVCTRILRAWRFVLSILPPHTVLKIPWAIRSNSISILVALPHVNKIVSKKVTQNHRQRVSFCHTLYFYFFILLNEKIKLNFFCCEDFITSDVDFFPVIFLLWIYFIHLFFRL